jgi:ATP-dependent DNA helicase RecQ
MTLLKERTPVMLAREVSTGGAAPTRTASAVGSSASKAGDIPCDEGLFQELRLVRKRLADDLGVPPYVIFSDVTLRHLARLYPERETEFLKVPGVGEKKLKDFGSQFMAAVSEWLATHTRQSPAPMVVTPPPVRKMKVENALSTTAAESLRQWRSGRSTAEIAAARDLGLSTIETHLAAALEAGEVLDPRAFYTEAEEAEMRKAFAGHDSEAMSPVFAQLEGRLSYGQLRIFRAMQKQGTGAGAERPGRE